MAPLRVLIVSAWEPVSGVRTAYRLLSEQLSDGVTYDAYAFDGWSKDSSWLEFCDTLLGPGDGSLSNVLVDRDYDLVHAIDAAYSPPYGVETWLRRARFRGGLVLMSQNSHPALTEKPTLPHVYIACSAASRDQMARTVDAPIRVIPNAVDLDFFTPPSASTNAQPPLMMWVGRSKDDHQKAISGFLYLAGRHPEYRYAIVDLDDGAARLELENWLGPSASYHHSASPQRIRAMYHDVAASGGAVISTSRFEGLPFALLEAAACGAAVIAPDVPGMEYLTHGRTALIYDRQAGLEGIEGCLTTLANSRARQAMTKQARAMVQAEYSAASMASSYRDAYDDALRAATGESSWSDQLARNGWKVALAARSRLR